MKVEIWHKRVSDEETRFVKGQVLDLFSVSDENTCELAYLHTSDGSLPSLQCDSGLVPEDGDIFVILDDDPTVHARFYEMALPSGCCEAPEFKSVTFDFDFRGHHGTHGHH